VERVFERFPTSIILFEQFPAMLRLSQSVTSDVHISVISQECRADIFDQLPKMMKNSDQFSATRKRSTLC
jgi:hypothetical protein